MLRQTVEMSRGNSDNLPFLQQLRIFYKLFKWLKTGRMHSIARHRPMKNGLC